MIVIEYIIKDTVYKTVSYFIHMKKGKGQRVVAATPFYLSVAERWGVTRMVL